MAVNKTGMTVIGIRRTKSKKSDAIWTTYFCTKPFTDYELENSDEIVGSSVEIVTTSEDFPIQMGDEVQFFYGKAMGDYQPVIDFKMISKGKDASSGQPVK